MRDPSILKKFRQDKDGGPVIFTGDQCIVKILTKFENYGCLTVVDTVRTIGIFDMEVDGKISGMFLAGRIEMKPSDIESIEEDGVPYVKLTFKKGDVFMTTTDTVDEWKLAFYAWVMYVKDAHLQRAMRYDEQSTIFDRIKQTCGESFPVNHSVYEAIFAHLSRDANNFVVPFRNTDMKGEFRRIKLSDVAHASRSTSARIVGAYFNEGVNAALTRPSTSNSMIEDMLRQ